MSAPYKANAFILNPASPEAAAIGRLFGGTLIFLGLILVLVISLIVYALVRYRERPGGPEAEQVFGSPRLETIWTLIPILSLAVLALFTAWAMRASDPPARDEQPDLLITAHQWWWELNYVKSGALAANEIHIPVGQRLLVELRSADVIHDFWVPQLARKIDIIPGHPNHIWLEADRPRTYLGVCAEFCGNEHAWMRFQVIAQPAQQFTAWLQEQLHVPAVPNSALAQRGRQLFVQRTCANCHRIAGTPAKQHIGPDLTHVASRALLAGGALENTPTNLGL